MKGALVLVGTPIGNLGDMSPRAAAALAGASAICCEDSRRTGRLLATLGIERSGQFLVANDHTEAALADEVVRRVAAGERVAVVSDAGMPAISDPGRRLVSACLGAELSVEVVPGPTAAVAALVTSGMAAGRFCFEGFLPRSGASRAERVEAIGSEERTVVLYEAPHRLARTLADLVRVCGPERAVVIRREITKLHDETWSGTLQEAVDRAQASAPRGEHVVVLDGRGPPGPPGEQQIRAAVAARLAAGDSVRDAADTVAAELGVARRLAYRLALESR